MAGKIEIPDELKKELPQSTWGKILGATPIVMTVIATMLAGLASSEMTTAQYDRSLAAQLQSKAGDQWSYFQAKKLRGAMQRNSFEMLQATASLHPINNPVLEKLPAPPVPQMDTKVAAALQALEKQSPENEIAQLLNAVDGQLLVAALQSAKDNALAFDAAIVPASQELDKLRPLVDGGDLDARRDALAAEMKFNAARYDAEARLNQFVAGIYELQVRKNNVSAEQHHARSGKFFIGMLAAQAAVIVSTFAIAARKKNFLWSIAAAAGVLAVIFSLYVYLYV